MKPLRRPPSPILADSRASSGISTRWPVSSPQLPLAATHARPSIRPDGFSREIAGQRCAPAGEFCVIVSPGPGAGELR